MRTGVTSVAFRKLDVEQIVKLAKKANLSVIEWGGDIHVPHGDIQKARFVQRLCQKNEIDILSYGSYYRIGDNNYFDPVLDTAHALGAKTIRVWAGSKGSKEITKSQRDLIIKDAKDICRKAKTKDINIAVEFHSNSLTDTNASAVKLLQEVDEDNFYSYWQENPLEDFETRFDGLRMLGRKVMHIHVFNWEYSNEAFIRNLLDQKINEWEEYLKYFAGLGGNRCTFLEFVKDESEEQFIKDAATLNEIVGRVKNCQKH